MKKVFIFVFTTFLVAAISLVVIILGATLNDAYLNFFEPLVTTSLFTEEIVTNVFYVTLIVTIAAFPTVVVNMVTRWWGERTSTEEGNRVVFAGLALFLLLFVAPLVLFMLKEAGMQVLVLVALFVSGLIIGGGGKEKPLPSWWK